MKFFIDTANVEEIRRANDMGIIAGVTTNPSLIAKEGRDYAETLAIIRIGSVLAHKMLVQYMLGRRLGAGVDGQGQNGHLGHLLQHGSVVDGLGGILAR